MRPPVTRCAGWLILAIAVAMIYGPLASFGFVQDDHGVGAFPSFDPTGKLFYRPLGELYCWVVKPLGSFVAHILSMLMLWASAVLTVLLAEELTHNRRAALMSGLVYIGASWIHLDPQMWLVGVFDNGATLFALASILLFMRRLPICSAIAYALALGFKESAFVVLPILMVWDYIGTKKLLVGHAHLVVFVLWLMLKVYGVSPLSLPATEAYVSGIGWHMVDNLWWYVGWMLPEFALAGLVVSFIWFLTIRRMA